MLALRPWLASDAPALRDAHLATPDLAVQLGGADLATTDLAAWFIREQLVFADDRRHWAIIVDGKAVGSVGLSHIERRHDTAWVFYWLAQGARGCGYAAAALGAVAEHAFADGLFRLELGHRVNNPGSCRVAARAGFTAEGIERRKLRYGDERFDVETHARLATDPPPSGLLPVELLCP